MLNEEPLREELVNSIGEMSALLEVCENPAEKFELRRQVRELFQVLDTVTIESLDSTSPEFREALTSLKSLTSEAKEAKSDLDRIVCATDKAAKALGKLEKLGKNVAKLV